MSGRVTEVHVNYREDLGWRGHFLVALDPPPFRPCCGVGHRTLEEACTCVGDAVASYIREQWRTAAPGTWGHMTRDAVFAPERDR